MTCTLLNADLQVRYFAMPVVSEMNTNKTVKPVDQQTDSDAATSAGETDKSSEFSELSDLSDSSDNERIPYTVNLLRTASADTQTTQQRKKRKKRSPYSLVVRLKYEGCNRPDRMTVPVGRIHNFVTYLIAKDSIVWSNLPSMLYTIV
jgi:hypothetical protein